MYALFALTLILIDFNEKYSMSFLINWKTFFRDTLMKYVKNLICSVFQADVYEPLKMVGKQLQGRKVLVVSSGGQHTVLIAKEGK